MSYRLGVDLGTTYTSAAVCGADGVPTMVGLGNRALQVPSVLFSTVDGGFVAGEAAERRGASDPVRLVREFKRRIGDEVPLLVAGEPFSAEVLTARLLAWVVQLVTQREGGPPSAVVVTHPANWGPYKREVFAQAMRTAGAPDARLLTEPEAAAIWYAARNRLADDSCIAVYDLGGGTFDAAILRRRGEGFELLGSPEGIEQLGGVDFDEAVFQHVLHGVRDQVASLPFERPEVQVGLARLRRDCVEAKEALSVDTETVVTVALPGVHMPVRLVRAEFEAMIDPMVTDTVGAMRRVLRSAGLSAADISAIVMIGGSSRIPLVQEKLVSAFDRPLALDTHPKHDVALGAALAGNVARALPPAPIIVTTVATPVDVEVPGGTTGMTPVDAEVPGGTTGMTPADADVPGDAEDDDLDEPDWWGDRDTPVAPLVASDVEEMSTDDVLTSASGAPELPDETEVTSGPLVDIAPSTGLPDSQAAVVAPGVGVPGDWVADVDSGAGVPDSAEGAVAEHPYDPGPGSGSAGVVDETADVESFAAAGGATDTDIQGTSGAETAPANSARTRTLIGAVAAVVVLALIVAVLIRGGDGDEEGAIPQPSASVAEPTTSSEQTTAAETTSPPAPLPASAPLPDGTLVTVLETAEGKRLYTVDAAGVATPLIPTVDAGATASTGVVATPSLSPDRQSIVYVSTEAGRSTLRVMAASGEGDRELFGAADPACRFARRPAWSPDGSQLVVPCVDGRGRAEGLRITGTDGSLIRSLNVSAAAVFPTWSSTGVIAYVELGPLGAGPIMVIDAVGGEPAPFTDAEVQARAPQWSPDGTTLLFVREETTVVENAWTQVADGTATRLTDSGVVGFATWSPSGDEVAVIVHSTNDARLEFVNLVGQAPRSAPTLPGIPETPAWSRR